MSFELRLALRFLRMAGKRAHTAFLSLISTLGIAVGVATVIISISLLSGMQAQVKDRLRDQTPHLIIEPLSGSAIERDAELMERFADTSIDVRSIVEGTAWASSESGSSGRPATISSSPDNGEQDHSTRTTVSIELASALGLAQGDSLIIVSPRTQLTPFGEVPIWKKITIDEIVMNNPTGKSSAVILDFDTASRFFATGGHPTRVELRSTPEEAMRLEEEIKPDFPELMFRNWENLNRPLFLALKLERVVMFATISLVVLVAALNLVSSLAMTIVEKRRQVGILATLGASRRTIGLVFLLLGLAVALAGSLLGTLFGVGFSLAADTWQLVELPGMPEAAPFIVEARDVAEINLLALVLAAVTTLYPVWAATKLTPNEALRED